MPTNNSKRGLASADEQTRKSVASKGGRSSKGGFATMDETKQKEISSKGGRASHGGGRPAGS